MTKKFDKPRLTVLSFSGGKGSSCLLWMVLLDVIKIDKSSFVVMTADPGMENSTTYKYVDMMEEECKKKGIDFYRANGGNLYKDILELPNSGKKRFDNPPYWTDNKDGTYGRLKQGCTQKYKIQPMDRLLRNILKEKLFISKRVKRLRPNLVEKWIGFSYDEVQRIKPSDRKYILFAYPLIELEMRNDDILEFFISNHLPIPQRSVCNACFANGLNSLKDMYENRPDDWKQAVNVDNSIRDWSCIGIRGDVYVSSTCIPLEDLPKINFDIGNLKEFRDKEEDYSCDSGYCFI